MTPYKQQKETYLSLIEDGCGTLLPPTDVPQREVLEAMAYSLCGGGKRVRGSLLLAFYQLFGGRNLENAVSFAASVEMVHAYSLIHDDLPCMDDDDLRRGKPSCHIAYGEATALLAGDGLLTLAFEVLADRVHQEHFSTNQILSCISILATSSGTKGMIGGQILDLANEGRPVTGEEMERTDSMKTGALLTAAALMGSILGGAKEAALGSVEIYGRKLGLAFQIVDDILDATSTTEQLGKPVDSDTKNKKSTYVSVYGLEQAKAMADQLTQEALAALQALGESSEFLTAYTKELLYREY